jgi:Cu/Ag efflux protein CusF
MNRRALLLLSVTLVLPAAAFAQEHQHHHGMAMQPASQAGSEIPMSEGVIKKVDKAGGKVTISHGPLENLGMPGMTMAFKVKDKAWLGKMKEGDKIRFVADYLDSAVTVVRYEATK